MIDARLQGTKLEIIDSSLDERIDPLLQQIEECELVAAASCIRDVDKRKGNWRRRRREIGNDFLVTDRFQDVSDRLPQLSQRHHALVVSQSKIKRDALRHV